MLFQSQFVCIQAGYAATSNTDTVKAEWYRWQSGKHEDSRGPDFRNITTHLLRLSLID